MCIKVEGRREKPWEKPQLETAAACNMCNYDWFWQTIICINFHLSGSCYLNGDEKIKCKVKGISAIKIIFLKKWEG